MLASLLLEVGCMSKTQLEPGPFVVPMPAVLIGANVAGRANFQTAAFVSIVNFKPAIIACGLNPTHHTCTGLVEAGCFSVNLPSAELVEAADWCGLVSGRKVDKSKAFQVVPGSVTGAPLIGECRLSAECRLVDTKAFAADTVYFGEVVGVTVDEEVLTNGSLDWSKVAPMLFTFPDKGYWKLGEYVAEAWSVGKGFNP